jgi:glycosyltransferase involved in cell wall biosynthesis
MKPLVSVCCLTYNHAPYIAEALDGMLMQKDVDLEILIHDDASSDGTEEILRDYERRYPDIVKPLYEKENQYSAYAAKGFTNISAIFNFPRAKGKYIAMCEGDDFWNDDHKLARQSAYMEEHDDCTLCFHSAHMLIADAGKPSGLMRPYRQERMVTPQEIIDKKSGYPTASLLLRTDIMMKLPEFYMKAPIGDIPMQLTMAADGYGYYFDEPMCTYRYARNGSWTQELLKSPDAAARQQRYAQQMKEMYERFDSYSHGRYHEETLRAYGRLLYGTKLNTRDWDGIYDPSMREYLKEQPLRIRALLRLEKDAPGLFHVLQNMFT